MSVWLLAAASMVGCSAASGAIDEAVTEAVIERGGGGDVDLDLDDDGSFAIETEDGSFAASSGSVPDAWPADIPLPTGLTAVSSTDFSDQSGARAITVTGTTSNSIDDLEQVYDDAFTGWDEVTRSRFESNDSVTWQVGFELDDRQVFITASQSGSDVILTISSAVGGGQ